jgi:hypothetical protein
MADWAPHLTTVGCLALIGPGGNGGRSGAPQVGPPVFRHLPVDLVAVGLRREHQKERPEGRNVKHLRRTKLLAAFAVAALVGAGSYTATYRALVIISRPSALAPTSAPRPTAVATAVPSPFRSNA